MGLLNKQKANFQNKHAIIARDKSESIENQATNLASNFTFFTKGFKIYSVGVRQFKKRIRQPD